MELVAPITQERFGVQIKSQANLATFLDYQRDVSGIKEVTRFYFAVHSPAPDLQRISDDKKVALLRPAEIAGWSVKYGLVEWLIKKAG